MKYCVFCVIAGLTAVSYGGLFDSALNAVNKATEVVNKVDEAKKTVENPQAAVTPTETPTASSQPAAMPAPATPVSAATEKPSANDPVLQGSQIYDADREIKAMIREAKDNGYPITPPAWTETVETYQGKRRSEIDKLKAEIQALIDTEKAKYEEAKKAKAEAEKAAADKRAEDIKALDSVYKECRKVIEDTYTTGFERQQKISDLSDYFNHWKEGAGPINRDGELISLESANKRLEELKAEKIKKAEEDAAKAAAEQEAKEVLQVKVACEKEIEGSKLSWEGKSARKNSVDAYFAGADVNNPNDMRMKGAYRGGSESVAISKAQADAYLEQMKKEFADLAALTTSTNEAALRAAAERTDLDTNLKQSVAKQLVMVTSDVDLLTSYYKGNRQNDLSWEDKDLVAGRLAAFSDKLTDENLIEGLLGLRKGISTADREKLIARLPEEKAVKFVRQKLDYLGVHSWNDGEIAPFWDAIAVMKKTNSDETKAEMISLVLKKFDEFEKDCHKSFTLSWGASDKAQIAEIVRQFPQFDDATLAAVICGDETSWKYFIDKVSADVAYDVLAGGKAKSGELEAALAKKLPKERVDMKVYNGAHTDAGKKALSEMMPPELKAQAAAAAETAFKSILEKAKVASKDTFALEGFYLGMSIDDAKIVLAHHFPDLEIKEGIDGKGSDAEHALYVAGQKSPFCFADMKSRKVRLFNFGKKLLRKWYDFDVQTYLEWAAAYGDKTGADMRMKMIEKETTVYEDDGSESYTVWFHQESYQYKSNMKGYLLTYFGEERDFTIEGGIGGDLIKERAAPDFRYVRGDPGSLRARIVTD